MSDDRKDLPPVTAPNFNERLRETISTYLGNRGNKLDRGVTLRDLSEAGIIAVSKGFLASPGGSKIPPISGPGRNVGAYEPDLTPPPTPEGFTASAAISNIFIEHAAPLYPQGHGHGRTIVYGATWTGGALPTFTNAVKITEFTGTVFAHPTNPATTWHLWIKWQSADGVLSAAPAGGTNGMVVTTGQDVSLLVKAMTGPGNPFTVLAVDTIINGVTFPAGTYSTKAFIQDLQVTTAKIANLAVDDAKIANLSVSKLDAGSLKVGSYISSANYLAGSQGFAVWANGLAEFNNVVVRGGVYASYGSFTGTVSASTINGGTINGAQFNSGSYTGYGWPAGTGTGAHLSSSGLLIGNPSVGRYIEIQGDGNLYAPQFSIVNGVANFGGALSAATGTFSGAVSGGTFSTNSGLFTVDASGKMTAIEADIQRRVVMQTGTFNPGGHVPGGVITEYGTENYPPGTVIALNPTTFGFLIPTDIYDSYLTTTGVCQKFGVSLHPEGSAIFNGGTGDAQFAGTAEAVVNRTYSVGGVNTTNDSRVYINVTNLYCTIGSVMNYYAWPTFRWKLFKL